MNNKYKSNLLSRVAPRFNDIPFSILNESNILDNSWLTGFTDSDGHFGIKIVEAKPKSETRKRSVSFNVSLRFRLDQRSYDRPTATPMNDIMEKIANVFLATGACKLKTIKNKSKILKLEPIDILSIEVSALDKLQLIINYFNNYPLLGVKSLDYKD